MGDGEKAENLADDLDVAGVVDIKPMQNALEGRCASLARWLRAVLFLPLEQR